MCLLCNDCETCSTDPVYVVAISLKLLLFILATSCSRSYSLRQSLAAYQLPHLQRRTCSLLLR